MTDPRLLHVDPGGFANFFTETGPEKTAAIVEIYEQMGLHAVNVSARELADDAERFIALVGDSKTPYISANLVDEASGEAIFPSHVIFEIRERRVAVIGVTQRVIKTWERDDGSVIKTADPESVLPPLAKRLRETSDAVILLAHVPRVRLKPLLEAASGIDMVIGADGYSLTGELQEIAGVPVSYAGRQGQAVGLLRCRFLESGMEVTGQTMTRLTTDLPEDPTIKKLVDAALAKIESRANLD